MPNTVAEEEIICKANSGASGKITLTNKRVMLSSNWYHIDSINSGRCRGEEMFPIQNVTQIKVATAKGRGFLGLTSAYYLVIKSGGTDYIIMADKKDVPGFERLISEFNSVRYR
jgi:hypothetical protein